MTDSTKQLKILMADLLMLRQLFLKPGAKISCFTFAEPHLFTAGRDELSWLDFLFIGVF